MKQTVMQTDKYLTSIIGSLSIPVLFIHLDYRVETLNSSAESLYEEYGNFANRKCYNLKFSFHKPCKCIEPKICPIEFIKKNLKPITFLYEHSNTQEQKRNFEIIMHPFFDSKGLLLGAVETWYEITRYINKEEQLLKENKVNYHSSMHDSLTKLPNRRLLIDRIEQSIHHKSRVKKTFGIYFLDLDLFKEVNDMLGHLAGDLLLIEVAKRLKVVLRKEDTVARLGGDEFMLVVGNGVDTCNYEKIAKKVVAQFTKPFEIGKETLSVTCSIGVSIFPKDGETCDILLSHADAAMYIAKNNTKKRYAFYTDTTTLNTL